MASLGAPAGAAGRVGGDASVRRRQRWADVSAPMSNNRDTTATGGHPRIRAFLPEPSVPRLVGTVWALLLVNTLAYSDVPTVIPFPRQVGQAITMGALVCALGLALVLNQRLRFKPSPYLLLLSLLLVVSIASSLRLEAGVGALFRCFRGTVFLATLWLLSCWWRGDLRFVRYHVRILGAVLLTVLVGLVIAPGKVLGGLSGRLVGAIWPIPAPQVGQYAAVVAGLVILLWLTRSIDGQSAAWIAPPAIVLLLLSHTRTAAIAFVAALVCAILSLVRGNARARRAIAVLAGLAGMVAVAPGQPVQQWLARGQDADQLASLTGRQNVWDALLAQPRTISDQWIGVGLTDKSFNGLSIDSSWLVVYYEQGFIGIAIVAVILVGLLVAAALRPPSPGRACAIFLILYCVVASFTEVGLGDASPYLLHLAVATALLSGAPTAAVPATSHGRP